MVSSVPHPAVRPLGRVELVAVLALVQALQALAIDSMLPALGEIAHDLGVEDNNRRALVVGMYLLGIGTGSLFPGTLCDRFGRKPVLLGCIGAYIASCLGCALVHDFTALVIVRFIGGFGAAGLAVVPSAILRDQFEGDRMASLQSLIGVVFMLVPMLAPSIGQLVMVFAGWRWIFGFMALMGVGMAIWIARRLPETLHPEYRQRIDFGTIFGNAGTVLTTRASLGYVLATTATMGITWGYVQTSQQLIAEHFGAGAAFPLIFGGMALGMALANFGNSRIVERFGARRVGHTALIGYLGFGLIQFWLAHRGGQTLWQFVPIMTLGMTCLMFMSANFASIALQPFGPIAGAAASLQVFIRTLGASLIGAAIGQGYDNTARPLSSAMLVAGLFALAMVLWSERGRLFRRMLPPGTPRPIIDL